MSIKVTQWVVLVASGDDDAECISVIAICTSEKVAEKTCADYATRWTLACAEFDAWDGAHPLAGTEEWDAAYERACDKYGVIGCSSGAKFLVKEVWPSDLNAIRHHRQAGTVQQ
jgi:hypothetical protein